VRITESAIKSAVELSQRFIKSRALPDKALDLVSDAASHISMQQKNVPVEIQLMRASLEDKKSKLKNLRDENSNEADTGANELETDILGIESELGKKTVIWEKDKLRINAIQKLQDELASLSDDKGKQQLRKQIQDIRDELVFLRDEVNQQAILEQLAESTGKSLEELQK
jgi:ATP-dependent Clp protease ATP-binding subunit ClpB